MTPLAKARLVKDLAAGIGLSRVGITPAGPVARAAYYRNWLAAGHGGTMRYLHRHVQVRADPRELLPGARSIICAALNYRRPEPPAPRPDPAVATPAAPTGRIAAYARGRDYHIVLRGLLADLAGRLRAALDEPAEFRICVDTAPVLERELAAAAGIGWIGKNTCIIAPGLGSYLFLGEIVTTLELAPDAPATDHCGTCTRCLDACPTQALFAPYQMDASRCISYLTIEHRGEIPAALQGRMGDWVYGCDVCQEACPHNRAAPVAEHPDLAAEHLPARVALRPLVDLRAGEYRRLTRQTAARRASRAMWRRNAAIALRNAGGPR